MAYTNLLVTDSETYNDALRKIPKSLLLSSGTMKRPRG
jgi:hypothetical protein